MYTNFIHTTLLLLNHSNSLQKERGALMMARFVHTLNKSTASALGFQTQDQHKHCRARQLSQTLSDPSHHRNQKYTLSQREEWSSLW